MSLNIDDIILDPLSGDPTGANAGCIWFREDLNQWRGMPTTANTKTFAMVEDLPAFYSGATNYYTGATNIVSTSSASYADMSNMVIYTPPAGTYLVLFSAQMRNSSNTGLTYFRISPLSIINSERMLESVDETPCSSQSILVLDGFTDVKIQWYNDSASQSNVSNRSLILIKLS